MDSIFEQMYKTLGHLETLHNTFEVESNYDAKSDYETYKHSAKELRETLSSLEFYSQLYDEKNRQMILADFYEYVFLGRGFYSMVSKKTKGQFIKALLHFTNLLSSYEAMTVSNKLRKIYVENLGGKIGNISAEAHYQELVTFDGKIGLPMAENDASSQLNKYFDSILPKTAGGLWHELLVYSFLLRNDVGYIVPLILHQRLIGLQDHIVPPDFLIITYDKNVYGIEVGTKKEIQSGTFSLKTNIPTATINTENSRVSDRCPICKRWIAFCDPIINKYSNLDVNLPEKPEYRCLTDGCEAYDRDQIAQGKCPYVKYSRKKAITKKCADHNYADGYHYHYKCVLDSVGNEKKREIIEAKDEIALKTHFPYYSGLETLTKRGP